MKALPDVDGPTNKRRSKTVVFFHDESMFMSNEDQPKQWGMKGEKIMKPKSKGAGIMVSDFVDEHNGFLALSDEEHDAAKASNPRIRKYAHEFLEYGESKEGYWTRDKFIAQMARAIEMAEIKYPKEDGWCHIWVFDHSSCHAAMADDALDVNRRKTAGHEGYNMEWEIMEDVLRCSGWIKSCKGNEDGSGRTWHVNRRKDG